jgi:calcium release-activated calcium channel protein 1
VKNWLILQLKFHSISPVAAWTACVLMIPVMMIFVLFAWYFYRSLIEHRYHVSEQGLQEMELLVQRLDQSDENLGAGGFKGVLRIQEV